MDPAPPEAIKEAISKQGEIIGRHDNMLRGIMDSLQELHHQISHLATTVMQPDPSTNPPVSTPPEPAPPPQPSPCFKEPFVPSPEPFSGELGSCGQFILNCSLVFDLQPLSYPSDKAKVAFMINLLRGKAAKWATALWYSSSPVLASFDSFTCELRKVFDHPVKGREATRRLLALCQGSQSVASFSIEFRILANECGWDESALKGIFVKGLSEQLKDELATRDEPSSLDELIALAIKIDNRLRERSRERADKTRRFSPPAGPSTIATPSFPPPTPVPSAPPGGQDEPMQLGRARLDPQERQRRLHHRLCFYCGQPGHFLASCPLKPKEWAHH